MSIETIIKAITASVVGILSYFLGNISQLAIILMLFMFFDYVTGMISAYYENKLSTKEGVKGIIKKFCFMIMVLMGYSIDVVVANFSGIAGLPVTTKGAFGFITICWLIGTEGISIIQNLEEIGIPVLPGLKAILQKIKGESEKVGGQDGK
jgi:toxin secretion/phage lysis holin